MGDCSETSVNFVYSHMKSVCIHPSKRVQYQIARATAVEQRGRGFLRLRPDLILESATTSNYIYQSHQSRNVTVMATVAPTVGK